jgi:PIN domain nuclease of toxin-antitoxin system
MLKSTKPIYLDPEPQPILLLDTHVLIWLMQGNQALKPVQGIIALGARQGKLLVSPISFWEISLLTVRGRIHLTLPCDEWVAKSLQLPGLSVCDITPAIAVEANYLPGEFHNDPADRILVASARLTSATVVTCDQKILAYAKQGYVKALAC